MTTSPFLKEEDDRFKALESGATPTVLDARITSIEGDVTDAEGEIVTLKAFSAADNFVIHAAGVVTTAGGDANETVTVTGAAAGDMVIMAIKTAGSSPVVLRSFAPGTNKIDYVMSADPSTDHVMSYIVLKAN
jgi:shikimate 5-dehydrogenase